MIKKIPNCLTILRLLLIPFFLFYLYGSQHQNRIEICLAVFLLAALTDWADGHLARKLSAISDFGKIMDPLADKLIVLAALSGITWLEPYRIPYLIFFLILLREILITILREIYKHRKIIIPADNLGKIKTFSQMLGLVFAYAFWKYVQNNGNSVIPSVVTIWFVMVTMITLYSGFSYLKTKRA